MDPHFESVYVNDSQNRSQHKLLDMERLKIGEVFQVRQDHFAFVCIHCSQEFPSFQRFTAHIASHYQNAMHWMTPSGHNDPMEMNTAEEQPASVEPVEWLFDNSSNDSHQNSNESSPQRSSNIECDVELHEEYKHVPTAQPSYEHTENGLSHESQCFKVKHPLMRVNETPEAKRIQPYFTRRDPFERTADQQFKCPFCEFIAATRSAVREHLFGHVSTKMFACKICDRDFERPRELHDHIEQAHNEVAILWPDRKPKRMAIEQIDSRGNVRESNVLVSPDVKIDPRMLMHSPVKNEPKYDANGERIRSQCYICQKTFSRPNGFMKHLKVHTEEKNYQCITCGAQFRRSDHLSRHQLIHEAPKFKCDVCDMTFRRSDKLLEHRRKHAESMNFTCENCGLGFMELASIKTHVSFHCKGKTDGASTSTNSTTLSTNSTITTELDISQTLHEPHLLHGLQTIKQDEQVQLLDHPNGGPSH